MRVGRWWSAERCWRSRPSRTASFVVERNPRASLTSAYTFDEPIVTADARIPKLRINTRASYTALANRQGIRLNVWQFDLSPLQRPTTLADALPRYWADRSPCAVGCTPPGLVPGWPLKPFHEQHVVRAGINEVRPANLHVALDIQANDLQAVYPIYSGRAYPAATGSYGDYNIRVGPYIYWHVVPRVHAGQWVTAYKTVLGQVETGFGHIAFSQGSTARTLNPLRPGGGLVPYTDTEPPVIGVPHLFADGRVIVRAFDPQSFIHKLSYLTPVLAPSSLAWRLYDSKGHALTGLEWAMRGSQNYPPGDAPIIYAPGASNPGFECFFPRADLHTELGLQPRRRTHRPRAVREDEPRPLQAHCLRVGLEREHIRARLQVQLPARLVGIRSAG